ncbi:MAG: hypothetical protein WCK90_06025 [archaeon]
MGGMYVKFKEIKLLSYEILPLCISAYVGYKLARGVDFGGVAPVALVAPILLGGWISGCSGLLSRAFNPERFRGLENKLILKYAGIEMAKSTIATVIGSGIGYGFGMATK